MRIGQNLNNQQIAFQKNLLSKGFKKVAKAVKKAVKVDPEYAKNHAETSKYLDDVFDGKIKPSNLLDA